MFTANFDGDIDSYLDELAVAIEPEAAEIWGRCVGCPRPAVGAALKAYLWRNQLQSGVVFAAYGQAGVAQIRGALEKRARLADFVVRAQEMSRGAAACGVSRGVRIVSTVELDLADIQGDILRAYGNSYDCTSYAFVQITGSAVEAREWFAGLLSIM